MIPQKIRRQLAASAAVLAITGGGLALTWPGVASAQTSAPAPNASDTPTGTPTTTPTTTPTATPTGTPTPAPSAFASAESIPQGVRLQVVTTDIPVGSTITIYSGDTQISLFGQDHWTTTATEAYTFTVAPVSPGYAPYLTVEFTLPNGDVLDSNTVHVAAGAPAASASATGAGLTKAVRLMVRLSGVPAGSTVQVLHAGTPVSLYSRSSWKTSAASTMVFTIKPVRTGYAPDLRARVTLADGTVILTNIVRVAAR